MGNCITSPRLPHPERKLPHSACIPQRIISHGRSPVSPFTSSPPPPSLNFPSLLDPSSTPSDLSSLYTLGAPLGSGSFATVHLCTSLSTGTQFACKSILKRTIRSTADTENVRREISNMKTLSEDAAAAEQELTRPIVKLYDVVQDSHSIHLIIELCRGGSLEKRLLKRKKAAHGIRNEDRIRRVFTEAETAKIAKSLLEALQACHSRGIIHRDVKPANILFVDESNDSPIKLADFGLSTNTLAPSNRENVKEDRSLVGTPLYMAPEIFESRSYGVQGDVWSAGVLLYVLLSGTNPYHGVDEDTQSIESAILYRRISFLDGDWDSVSAPAKELVQGMLCRDVTRRMTVSEALDHPWILRHCS